MRMPLFIAFMRFKQALGLFARARRRLTASRKSPRPLPPELPRPIPKRVWIYWHQGEAEAPELVRFCIRSWRERNSGWTVEVLDRASALERVAMPPLPETISVAHYADVLRMRLLKEYGGVWADATTFCSRPLDDWLPAVAHTGLFVFAWIDGDRRFLSPPRRSIGNWFIAAEKNGEAIRIWECFVCEYWKNRWKETHYYWHHDSFDWLVLTNRTFRRIWRRTPRLGALAPHLAFHLLTTSRDAEVVRQALESGAVPLHKFSWKRPTPPEAVMALLADASTVAPTALPPSDGGRREGALVSARAE